MLRVKLVVDLMPEDELRIARAIGQEEVAEENLSRPVGKRGIGPVGRPAVDAMYNGLVALANKGSSKPKRTRKKKCGS